MVIDDSGSAEAWALLTRKHLDSGFVDADGAERMLITARLLRVFARLSKRLDAHHRQFGWSWAGFRVLNILWAAGDLEVRQIARLSDASRAAISSVVNTLETKGLAYRAPAEHDRRLVVVGLTVLGRAQLEQAVIGQAALEEEFFAHISRAEQRQLAKLLECLTDEQLDVKES
ncbi:MarR family winged helix-turn-helix transcriptional regulator [Streptomyces sp. NPDC057499]|uniref:MarR family winged helix-turn-helix transcriptional regulator n=1 Tax=Streptomyces sp. NPDC057499 TaxID=3346150 RepID=UPI0036AB1011